MKWVSVKWGFGEVGFGEMGFGEVGFGEMGFGEVGFGEMGFGEVGFGEMGFGEVGFGEMGFGEVGFGEMGFGEMDGNPCTQSMQALAEIFCGRPNHIRQPNLIWTSAEFFQGTPNYTCFIEGRTVPPAYNQI